MADVQYATNGKGNLAVALGAVGTGLGVLAGSGELGNLLGGGRRNDNPEDRPVSRYEMGLISENTLLKANQYSDATAAGLQAQIGQQSVWNATQEGILRSQQEQLAQLYTLTKLVVPNDSVMPGWGSVTIKPAG